MVGFMCDDTCGYPFREFNDLFSNGIDEHLRELVRDADAGDWSHVIAPESGGAGISEATMRHFDADWREDAAGYPGARAGAALFEEFKNVLLCAEEGKPIGAVWTRSADFSVSSVDVGGSYVVVVRSPLPPGNTPHTPGCALSYDNGA